MTEAEWKKVDFQDFVNDIGAKLIIEHAPNLLYSKKDMEHKAQKSLIGFILVNVAMAIYMVISFFFFYINYILITFLVMINIFIVIDLLLLLNYIKSRVYIKPIECWIEVYRYSNFYCLSYYPIFSGKCLPNMAKDIIYKLYQQEVLKSKIDITQIEIYMELSQKEFNNYKILGYFFQYGKDRQFREEDIDRNSWQFFPLEQSLEDNFIAVANWDHQFEWRSDLERNFDKFNEYSPWIIKRWNQYTLKPLTEDYKKKMKWNLRNINSIPKLKPWKGDISSQIYENQKAYRDLEILDEAIEKIIGENVEIKQLKDLENELLKFKIYFRDLNF